MQVLVLKDFRSISVNSYYKIGAYKSKYLSAEAREFLKHVEDECNEKKIKMVKGPVRIEVEFWYKDNRVRDLDNQLKLLLDSLKNRMFEDDSEIYTLKAKKRNGMSENRIGIAVFPLPEHVINFKFKCSCERITCLSCCMYNDKSEEKTNKSGFNVDEDDIINLL